MDSPLRDKLFVGRRWVFERLLEHLDNQPSENNNNNINSGRRASTSSTCKKSALFIVGAAGSGKSAILSEICFCRGSEFDHGSNIRQYQSQLRKHVLAYHFCCSHNKKTLTISNFINNLIIQVSKSPLIHNSHLIKPSDTELDQLLTDDPDTLFRDLFLTKLNELTRSTTRHLFLVVDGLDECYEMQLMFGENSNGSRTIAELLATNVDNFPNWLHILTSSKRCSKSVIKLFSSNKKIVIDDYKKDCVVNDFKQYMKACLLNDKQLYEEDSRLKEFQIVFETLHEKSSGCFLYLELVIQTLAQCLLSTREIRNIPTTLNGLYSFLFQRCYPSQTSSSGAANTVNRGDNNTSSADIVTIKQILSVLIASQIPMTRFDILDALVTRDCSKPYNPNHLEAQIRSLALFLWKDNGVGFDEQCIQIYHHSFTGWITDAKLCGREYVVDPSEGHAMLALSAACFYDLNRVTSNDIREIVYNLSQSSTFLMPPLDVHLLALWVLWIGLDPQKFYEHLTSTSSSSSQPTKSNQNNSIFPRRRLSFSNNAPSSTMCQDSIADKIITLASYQYEQPALADVDNEEEVASDYNYDSLMSMKIGPQEVFEVDHHGQTMLMRHLAAGGANTQFLINAGSNINHEDMSGWSPLIVACKTGRLEPVKVLLDAGAEIDHRDYEGWTAVRAAVWEGFYDIVCLLLSRGANVDLEDNDQRTPLRAAAWRGFEDIAKVLIKHGANVNQTDRFGQTPLNAAAYMGNLSIVEILLSGGAYVDQTDQDGRTALTISCLYEQHQVAQRLLESGANVNHQDKERISPLIAAAYKGNIETVRLLLNHPVSRESHLNVELVDNGGRTALLAAASQGHLEIVQLLIVKGAADCSVTDPDGRSLLSVACIQGNLDLVRWVLRTDYDEGCRDLCGWTPMHVAAFEGRVEVCRELLEFGLSVNDTDDDGRSPLICAAQEGHLDVVNFLVQKGASIDHIAPNSGQNALRVAALEGHSTVVEYLLASGSNINLRDKDGRTTLYVLAQEDKLRMSELFVEWQADVHMKDFDGRSPLMVAAWQGHSDMCLFLIQNGADVNCVDIESRSVLQMAAWQGHTSIIRILCECGADVNSMCSQGATALTIAAQEGHIDVMECLLEFGADSLIQDKHGRSAYKMAMSGRNLEVKLLMERAVDLTNVYKDDHSNNLNRSKSPPPPNRNSLIQQQRQKGGRVTPVLQQRLPNSSQTPPPQGCSNSDLIARVHSFHSQVPVSLEHHQLLNQHPNTSYSQIITPTVTDERYSPSTTSHQHHVTSTGGPVPRRDAPPLPPLPSKTVGGTSTPPPKLTNRQDSPQRHQTNNIYPRTSNVGPKEQKILASLSSGSPFSSLGDSSGGDNNNNDKRSMATPQVDLANNLSSIVQMQSVHVPPQTTLVHSHSNEVLRYSQGAPNFQSQMFSANVSSQTPPTYISNNSALALNFPISSSNHLSTFQQFKQTNTPSST